MRVAARQWRVSGICALVVIMTSCSGQVASDEKARAGIERLHQQDSVATLSDKADELEKLWDRDAVRIQPGRPAEVGRQIIYDADKRWEVKPGRERTKCYDLKIQDLQIAGDWAFEWGFGSYQIEVNGKTQVGYAKVMRVMRRQPDGSWKFARLMGVPETTASAAGTARNFTCEAH